MHVLAQAGETSETTMKGFHLGVTAHTTDTELSTFCVHVLEGNMGRCFSQYLVSQGSLALKMLPELTRMFQGLLPRGSFESVSQKAVPSTSFPYST